MPAARISLPAILLSLSCLATACGDDDGTVEIPCDIRGAACRRAIFELTARVREQPGATLPPSRIITRAQFADETRASVGTGMPSRQARQREEGLRVLALLPASSSVEEEVAESSISGVAAYYSPRDKAITIIDDAAEDLVEGSLTLSHEYVHSLQDQREGLAKLSESATSSDEYVADSAIIEGEATVVSDVALKRALGLPYERASIIEYLDGMLAFFLEQIEQSPAPFNQGLQVLPYPVGGRPLAEAYLAQGYPGVRDLFPTRPSALAGWIDLSRAALLPGPLTCDSPDAPAGYDMVGADRLGVTGLIALWTRLGVTGEQAYARARSWSSDSFMVFGSLDGERAAAVAWRIALADSTAASSLESALTLSLPVVSVVRSGSEVVITAATKRDVLAAWTTRNDCSTEKSRVHTGALFPEPLRYRR